jgi:hypothetical protein
MAKYKVKNRQQLLYPDGSVRGEAGYIVDTSSMCDRGILDEQADVLTRLPDRFAVASPIDRTKFESAKPAPKKAKKKATKKKSAKKKD